MNPNQLFACSARLTCPEVCELKEPHERDWVCDKTTVGGCPSCEPIREAV
jgi:hypothetical protein